VIWVIAALGLLLMDLLLDGLQFDPPRRVFIAAAVLGFLNALLWPFLSRVLLPFAVFTAGLFFLILNGVMLWLAAQIVPGFEVDSIWTATLAAFGVTAVNVVCSTLLTIDDDGSYYRNVINKRIRRRKQVEETDVPAVFFLEIDGLSKPVLEKAMALGYAPTIQRWLRLCPHDTTLAGKWQSLADRLGDRSFITDISQPGRTATR
jgi:uncharacterized membrane protein YvlD (DUF360 family)